jgi:hypothetical protein
MKSLIIIVSGVLISFSVSAADVSMAVPGAKDAAGRSVLTFIAKDPPGQRCNGNLQVAAEIANTYRVPIQSTRGRLRKRKIKHVKPIADSRY